MTCTAAKNWHYPNEYYKSIKKTDNINNINLDYHNSHSPPILHTKQCYITAPKHLSLPPPTPKPYIQMKPDPPKLMPTQSPICQAHCSVNGPLP